MYLVKYSCDNCRWFSWWILSIYYKPKLKSNISELSPKCLEFSEGTQLICPSFRHHNLITPMSPQQTTSCWRQALSIPKNDILFLVVSLYVFNYVFNFSPFSACRWWSKLAVRKKRLQYLHCNDLLSFKIQIYQFVLAHCFALTLIHGFHNVHHNSRTLCTE